VSTHRGRLSMAEPFDVFISYAHADGDWARVLAENLHQSGLEVYLDAWYIAPGDVLVHKLDEALARTATACWCCPRSPWSGPGCGRSTPPCSPAPWPVNSASSRCSWVM